MLAVALLPATASGEDGNIGTNAIEVLNDANLYPQPATGCTGNEFNETVTGFDWVKDCLPNEDLTAGTDAAAAKGHWNGFRVLDGFAGDDQDIFLTGGKENDHESWNPGPGSVGSSKYDITQAYLANNSTDAFFGMERRGNNGTTAFDWEFNKYAPNPNGSFPDYIPSRSEGDVLLTFEMQGAGNSGSATAFRFVYNDPDIAGDPSSPPPGVAADTDFDGTYEPVAITNIIAVINGVSIPSAPWGAVSSQGNWSTAALERFKFAEAKVPLSLIGITTGSVCDDISRYVQVRTRASSTENSDLKDLTKIFKFDFSAAPLSVTAAKGTPDGTNLTVPINADVTNGASGASLAYQWQYSETGNVGTWADVSGATTEDIAAYSAFETHDANPDSTSFTIATPNAASGSYVGKVWTVYLRLQVTRTLNSTACGSATSAAVTVKKVTAVDP